MITEIGTKIYYLKTNGNIILETGDCRGYVKETTVEEDFLNYAKLREYNKEQVGVIQLKYGELDKLLKENKANYYTVDISKEPHKLIFKWIDPETQEPGEPPKTETELLKEELADTKKELQDTKLELSMALVELTEMVTANQKA